jgi:ABC-type multidrug transport system ATPase subunit
MVDLAEAEHGLPGCLTAVEAVKLFCPELSPTAVAEKITRIFAPGVLDLPHPHRNRPISQLSHGMRQKVLIATLRDVPLWLLDEPTQGLDPDMSERFRAFVFRQRRTTIWVTHNLEDAAKTQRVVFLVEGRVAAMGPPEALVRWTGKADLQGVYADCASSQGVLRCERRGIRVDDTLPPDTFVADSLTADEIVVENAVYRRRVGRPGSVASPDGQVTVNPIDGDMADLFRRAGSHAVCWAHFP